MKQREKRKEKKMKMKERKVNWIKALLRCDSKM